MTIAQGMRIEIHWTTPVGKGTALNVLHGTRAVLTNFDQALCDVLAGDLSTAFATTAWDDGVATGCQMKSLKITDLSTVDGPSFETLIASNGHENSHPLPPSVALVATLRTALGGRRHRGRIYLPGYTEASNTSAGLCDSTTAAGSLAGLLAAKAAWFGHDVRIGVFSRVANTITEVTAITVNTEWDTQRRRK